MEKKFNLLMVSMPNFLQMERPPQSRQEGFKPDSFSIPVSELSEEEAFQYGEEMKQAFVIHCRKKRLERQGFTKLPADTMLTSKDGPQG